MSLDQLDGSVTKYSDGFGSSKLYPIADPSAGGIDDIDIKVVTALGIEYYAIRGEISIIDDLGSGTFVSPVAGDYVSSEEGYFKIVREDSSEILTNKEVNETVWSWNGNVGLVEHVYGDYTILYDPSDTVTVDEFGVITIWDNSWDEPFEKLVLKQRFEQGFEISLVEGEVKEFSYDVSELYGKVFLGELEYATSCSSLILQYVVEGSRY